MTGFDPARAATEAAAPDPAFRAHLRDVSHDGAVPVFDAPWEAQAFAMTLALHARGVFTWKDGRRRSPL